MFTSVKTATTTQAQHPSLRPVQPNECALAIAIPLQRDEFLADLADPAGKDFARHFREVCGLTKATPEYCWGMYACEVLRVLSVCEQVAGLGVTIHHQTRLTDLPRLLKQFPVVTLVTHSRFVPVTPADILDVVSLLAQLQAPTTPVQEAVSQAMAAIDANLVRPTITPQISQMELQLRTAAAISEIASQAEKLYWDPHASQQFNAIERENGLVNRLTRWEFEQAFPACIAPAKTIEFEDGMQTISHFVDAIPAEFNGVFDLTFCSSVIPAAPVRIHRQNCLVAANRNPIALQEAAYYYGLAINFLKPQPKPFIDALERARKVIPKPLWNPLKKLFTHIPGRRRP